MRGAGGGGVGVTCREISSCVSFVTGSYEYFSGLSQSLLVVVASWTLSRNQEPRLTNQTPTSHLDDDDDDDEEEEEKCEEGEV